MNTLDTIAAYLKSDLDKVGRIVDDSLRSDIKLLNATNNFLLAHPGKMIRPILALLVAKACSGGKPTEDSYRYASASQLLHTATLLHDDVADDGQVRRGKPTVLHLLGGRASVLLGDFWLVKAVNLILDSGRHKDKAIRLYSDTLGFLADGEMLQLQKAESGDTSEEDYRRIIYSKTASLFETSAVAAALSVDASEAETAAAREYSCRLGMAFQIKDDIFDYEPGADVGKPVGQDLMERKITIPLLGALKRAPAAEAEAVRDMVVRIDENPSLRDDVVAFVSRYDGMDYAKEALRREVEGATAALASVPAGKEKDMLAELAVYCADRKK